MTQSPFVEPLREAEAFHRNVFLMFDDTVASIREKTLSTTVINRQGPEPIFWLNNHNSEHRHLYIFETGGIIRFIQFIVKADEDVLKDYGAQYKAVCAQLGIDPVIPLLVNYGLFHPRDISRFYRRRKPVD